MDEIGASEAQSKFSELLDRVENGDEVVITRQGRAIAKLVPLARAPARDIETAREAARQLRDDAARHGGKFDWEEWKKYRDEGRK